jgi:hypothetical protein
MINIIPAPCISMSIPPNVNIGLFLVHGPYKNVSDQIMTYYYSKCYHRTKVLFLEKKGNN